MPVQRITAPDPSTATAFIVTDLEQAERATGVVRCAKKILVDGARTLARSETYSWAVLGQKISGASAGINAVGDERAKGIKAFTEGVSDHVRSSTLSLRPAKGVTQDDLGELLNLDPVQTRYQETCGSTTLAATLWATGIVTSASAALGDLDGKTVAIEGAGDLLDVLVATFTALGARVVDVTPSAGDSEEKTSAAETFNPFRADTDILLCGSKVGVVDHDLVAELKQQLLVPLGSVPVTARAFAVARQRDITVLPDFVTTSGPQFIEMGIAESQDALVQTAETRIKELVLEFCSHPEGPLLAACYRAEEFLTTWQESLPFGRPLA